MIRNTVILLVVLFVIPAARGQEPEYNHDRIAPSKVPPSSLRTAEKEMPGVKFTSVYKDNEKDFLFVGKRADGKLVSVKLDREGTLRSTWIYEDVAAVKVPKLIATSLQTEIQNDKKLTGFQPTRITLIDRFDALKIERATLYQFTGEAGKGWHYKIQIDKDGKGLGARSYIPSTDDFTKRTPLAPNAIPLVLQQGLAEALPGVKFSKIFAVTDKVTPDPWFMAFSKGTGGRSVEAWAHSNGKVHLIAVAMPLKDVPKAAMDALEREVARDDNLKGFTPHEVRKLRLSFIDFEDYFQFFGETADGRPMDVRVGLDGEVKSTPDTEDVLREEVGISVPVPRAKDGISTSGFAIVAARYGIEDRWVDVSETVREAASSGKTSYKPENLPDPAFGRTKSLIVLYSKDGKLGLSECHDNEELPLDIRQDERTLAEAPPRGFAVLAARYGTVDHWEGVTSEVRALVKDNRLEIKPVDAKLPDPVVGVVKSLVVAYSFDGKAGLVISHQDRVLNMPPEGAPVNSASLVVKSIEFPKPTSLVAFTPDSKQVVVGVEDGSIRVLDATTGREVNRLDGHSPGWLPVAVSATGGLVLSGGTDNVLRLWDLKTGREKAIFRGHTGLVFRVAFSPNAKLAASTSRDNTVRLWDVASGRELRQYVGKPGQFGDLAFSKDGKQLFFGTKEGIMRWWEPASGRDPLGFNVYSECEVGVVPLNDSRHILVTDHNALALWDFKSMRPGLRLERHTARVSGIALSPDGKRIASTCEDNTLKIWKLPEPGR